jgi:hypothetical protein
MKSRSKGLLVVAIPVAALLTVQLLPAWSQAPVHPRPAPKKSAKAPKVVIKETPIEEGDPQQQGTPREMASLQEPAPPPAPPPAPEATPAPPPSPEQTPAPAPAPAPATPKVVKPEEIGISFAPPQGWQQGDPTKFTLPGDICCAWSPDNVASIVAFVQRPGRPLNPKVLLEQSAKALESALGAEVKEKEVKDIGGLRGFSLVVTAAGNGAAIDGKGTVPTTQHWIGIPREQDVIVFLMTTPEVSFAQNEQVFQNLLDTLKVSGTQTPDQQVSR